MRPIARCSARPSPTSPAAETVARRVLETGHRLLVYSSRTGVTRHRAAAIAVVAVVLSRRNRACLLRRSAWLPCGGAFALMIGVAWGYTVGNASIQDDYRDDTLSCNGERLTSLDSRLTPFFSHDCVTQSRNDVLAALLAAIAIVLIEYRILLSLRQRTGGVNLPGKP